MRRPRRTTRLRALLALALAAFASLALAACGSDDGGGGGGGGEGGGAGGGSLTAASPFQIVSLDPLGAQSADSGTALASKALYDTLVERAGEDYAPSVATRWEVADDGRRWTFRLRDDVRFHDGSALTADDVVGSVRAVVAGEGPLASLWEGVEVTAPDARTVVFSGRRGLGTLLANLTTLEIVPARLATQDGFFDRPVGSGPFVFSAFSPGQELRLTANPDYWGGAPRLADLTLRFIPEVSSRVTALDTGEIDVAWGLPDDQLGALQGRDDLRVEAVPSYASYVGWFNSSRPPFDDARVRRAMWLAIDAEATVGALNPETGSVADAPVSSAVFGHVPQTPYEHDPAEARRLLAEAGLGDGFSTSMQFSGAEYRQFAQALASDWARIGVEVRIDEKERAVWLEDLLALDWDMNLQAQGAATGDADYLLGRLYTCEARRNGYCNPRLDRLLAEAAASADQDERRTLYGEAERIIWDEAVGIYPMDVRIAYAWRSGVEGFEPDPNSEPDFATVSNG